MHTAASETHKNRDITFLCFLFIHVRAEFQLWLDHVRHKRQHAIKSDIKLESHFLIIHKYSSIFVHECHVNEHGQGIEREGGGVGVERERDTPLEGRGRGEMRGKERDEGRGRGGESEKQAGKGGAEEGISHIEMRVLLSVFSLSPCITPWITTTPSLCWRNVRMHPLHTDTHILHPPSLHPLLSTELDRGG